jgi:tetratricopeptide (TPR) repeat protein
VFAKRAAVHAKLEDYESALADYKQASDLTNPTSPAYADLAAGRAEVFLELGAAVDAVTDAQAAYEADRSNPRYIFNLGKAYTLAGAPADAVKLLDKYIAAAEQENPEAYRLRSQAQAALGKFDIARQDIEHAIALDPEDHESHFVLGLIEVQDKNHPAAAKALGESIAKFKPKKGQEELPHAQAHLLKASVHEEHGKASELPEERKAAYEAQIAECEKLLASLPDSQAVANVRAAALFRRGVGERLLGRLGDAVKSFSEAIEINPGLAEAYFRRGVCFREMDEEMMALRDFEHAAAIEFDTPRAYFWQGLTWAKIGDYHKAIKAYGEAIDQSERYVPAYVNRGLAYVQLGDYEKAINDFNEAIRLQPTGADHYYKRGVAYSQAGEHVKAVSSLMNAIKFDDKMARAHRFLADELELLGRGDLAEEYRRKADELEKPASGG